MRSTIDFENFRIYISQNEYFLFGSKLPDFSGETFNLDDPKNTYSRIIKAMYVLSYLGGVSLKNLTSENNLAKSLAHFYFYYFLKKVVDFPDLFKDYDASILKKLEWHFHNFKRHWVWYHPRMKMSPSEFKRNDNDVIRNIHRLGKKVYYDAIGDLRENIGTDYKTFLAKDSKGLTKIGQTLFQESTQVYVFCILAAQVKTRWKIVGDGVKSLQTQMVFQNQLVQERIVENNLTKLISDLRVAIKDSKVRLNFCVSPGLILIPSNMTFIEESPGYNNIITVARIKQKFGVNHGLNKTLRKSQEESSTNLNKNIEKSKGNDSDTKESSKETDSKSSKEPSKEMVTNPKNYEGSENIRIFATALFTTAIVRLIILFI